MGEGVGGTIAAVLVAAGTLLAVLAAIAAALPGSVYRRLHYQVVVTSAAAPLIGIGAAVAEGPGLTTALVLVIVLLLAGTGPVLGMAVARVNAQHDGIATGASPE
ncbi:hypothetical protein HFP15_15645 [Amycolatopsis sp. K13G38]|uniref:Monovalent cation/H(+) antiporter subunit G n=1 Tax=Amycolatopsis acididurans TaxID=2724524 RepID=A0ABX1J3W7_9PSEU|nr:monovalent cation/H(+) antiporter subunit G [Amycolatopsis acididurans]NKQ54319.1 hypothetical protein [Amycolatopsis acididurans]